MEPPWNGGITCWPTAVRTRAFTPQWSPPLGGGSMLLQDAVTPLDTWLPQWSPPLHRGSTLVCTRGDLTWYVPQWSPPSLHSESTLAPETTPQALTPRRTCSRTSEARPQRPACVVGRRRCNRARHPQREQVPDGQVRVLPGAATIESAIGRRRSARPAERRLRRRYRGAMEPVVRQREHFPCRRGQPTCTTCRNGARVGRREQTAGSTSPCALHSSRNRSHRRTAGAPVPSNVPRIVRLLPQQRPPSDGGSTPVRPGDQDDRVGAPMEPAARRREHGLVVRLKPRLDGAAMEPAAGRREHVLRHPQGPDAFRAAMEPAIDRREHSLPADDQLLLRKAAIEPALGREHRAATGAANRRGPGRNGACRRTAGAQLAR